MSERKPVEVEVLEAVVTRYFVQSPGPWQAWLLYEGKTGKGVAVVVGPVRPGRKLVKRFPMLGTVKVAHKFQPLLALHGPQALRWDGNAIVAAGH